MMALLNLFWGICLLRKGPQDLPASRHLLVMVILLGILIDLVNLSVALPEVQLPAMLGMSLSYSLVLITTLSVLLYLLGYAARILQTLTALFATGVVISLCSLPFIIVIGTIERPSMFSLIILALQIWSLVVASHILSKALNVHMLMAGVLAFGYYMLGFKVVDLFLPQGG